MSAAAPDAGGRAASALAAVLLPALALWRLRELWPLDWYASHEGMAPLERVVAVAVEMAAGDYYPRWLSAAFHGHGLPFFNFYSPAAYWTAGLAHHLGLPVATAVKAVIGAAACAGALGMWVWLRRHAGTAGAATGAALYLGAPYLAHDIFVRGAFAEVAALGLLPWLFAAIDRAFSPAWRSGVAATGVAAAAIVLTHNLSALMIAPFAALYAGTRALAAGRAAARRFLWAPAAAAGLSAFYWLPLAAEAGALRPLAERLSAGPFHFSQHFLAAGDWWPGGSAHAGPQAGTALVAMALLGALLLWRADAARRRFGTLVGALALAAAALTLPPAEPLYAGLPGLAFVQFPWRFLGPATLFLAALAALAAPALPRPARVVPALAALGWVAVGPTVPAPEETPLPAAYATDARVVAQRLVGRLSMRDEYLPRWATGSPAPLALSIEPPGATLGAIARQGHRLSFEALLPADGRVEVPFHYFPGWRARAGALAIEPVPSARGFVALALPAGRHRVELEFGSTGARRLGWSLSAATLAALAGAGLGGALRGRRRGT